MRTILERLKPVGWGMAAIVCALAVGGCARSIGQPIAAESVDRLTPGKTTYADVVRQFGKAVRVRGHGNGTTVAHWQYLKDTPDGTDYDSLRIAFDRDGRMIRIVDWRDSGEEDDET